MSWTLTVWGKPRTKKNHGIITTVGAMKRAVLLPSPEFRQWEKSAQISIGEKQDPWCWHPAREIKGLPAELQPKDPPRLISKPIQVNCRALFYRDRRVGDAVGFYQGLADLLEARGVVENDIQIVSWDGSRLLADPERPRVEVVLEEVTANG